jgi:hypothetical protein
VALPLAARGISVEGVDASAAMVERLRAKPGGESVPVVTLLNVEPGTIAL